MNTTFYKQIGLKNLIYRGIKLKILKKFFKTINYKTITNNFYQIEKWDPSGTEVYMTDSFCDWGNEYLFLNSINKRENDTFLDVGCHTGYFPVLFKNYFKKIIGFEPSTKCVETLKKLDLNNFLFHKNFVGDEEIEVLAGDSEEGYSFYDDQNVYKKKEFSKIKQITIDNFVDRNRLKKITAIKIDVDGFDLKVLFGAKKTIEFNRPSIMIENYSDELFNFFDNLNYNLISIISDKKNPYNLILNKFENCDKNKWVKMMCCIPKEFSKNYNASIFKGNLITGINKDKILKTFDIKSFK